MKKPEYRGEVAAAVHEGVRGMHRLGLVDKKTMREFDLRCLTSVEDFVGRNRGKTKSEPRRGLG
jgi:putative transcriptional regulator